MIEILKINDLTIFYSKNPIINPKIQKNIPKIINNKNISNLLFNIPQRIPEISINQINFINESEKINIILNDLIKIFPKGIFFISIETHQIFSFEPLISFIIILDPSFKIYIFDMLILYNYFHLFIDFFLNININKVFFNDKNDCSIFLNTYGIFINNIIDISILYNDISYFNVLKSQNINLNLSIVDWRIRPLNEDLILILINDIKYLPMLLSIKFNEKNFKKNLFLNKIKEFQIPNKINQLELILNNNNFLNDKKLLIIELFNFRNDIAKIEDININLIFSDQNLLNLLNFKNINEIKNYLKDESLIILLKYFNKLIIIFEKFLKN